MGGVNFVGVPEISTVEWSTEASLSIPKGEPDADVWPYGFNALMAHSYVALITFADGRKVAVGMPRAAAKHPTDFWEPVAREKAVELYKAGFGSGFAVEVVGDE